jgi:acetyltransferase
MMKGGEQVLIRPIRPTDEPLLISFHKSLSDESVYLRYFHFVSLSQRIAHERLGKICDVDYEHDMALVAERKDRQILAVARLAKLPHGNDAEIAVIVSDEFQRRGLGTQLVRRLVEIARLRTYAHAVGAVMPENTAMQRVFRSLGFELRYTPGQDLTAILAL